MKKLYFLFCLLFTLTISAQTVNVKFTIDASAGLYPNADYHNILVNGTFAPGEEWWGWGVALADDGTGDDLVSGDGIWTGSRDIAENFDYEFVVATSGPADNWGGWGQSSGYDATTCADIGGNYLFSTVTSDLEISLSVLPDADASGDWGGCMTVNTLSVNDFELTPVKAFPNPTDNVWNIKTNNLTFNSIQVFDVLGKQVLSLNPETNNAVIDATNLSNGLYFAKVNTDKGSSTLKLIKN